MWEYEVKAYKDTGSLKEGINILAKEGWEVVTFNIFSELGWTQALFEAATSSGFIVIFKRKLDK
jgi:hypothetical protein